MHQRFRAVALALAVVGAIASIGALDTSQIVDENQAVLDWNEVDIESFPALPDGQTFSSITTVGDLDSVSGMTVEEATGGDVPIGQIEGLDAVRLGDLANSVDGLANTKVGDSPAIAKIVESFVMDKANKVATHYADKFADKLIGEVFKDIPALKDLPLGDFKGLLSGDPLSSIQGLANTALGKIPGLDKVSLDKIPGLNKVPITKVLDLARYSPVAILDQVYGASEANATYKPISGSDVEGYSVPCKQANCAYIELADYKGSLKGVLKPADLLTYHGARWIVGGPNKSKGEQMVKGGSGVLGAAFGGKEPTGRPLGKDFKLVLTKTNEGKGSATFSLYTRACSKFSGCTPFIIGPIPLLTFNETDLVFLGTPDLPGNGKGLMPKWADNKIAKILGQFEPPIDGDFGGADNDAQQSDCATNVLSKMEPASATKGQSFVPTMVKAALAGGYSANQTAFLIAVAEDRYSFNADPNAIISQFGKTAKTYINDKFVNYFSAAATSGTTSSTAQKAGRYQAALKPCQTSNCSASGKMIRPSQGVVTSEFGMRLSPTMGVWRLHAGIDLGDPVGATVRAADCGTVAFAGWESGYGQVVILKHGRYYTRHAHASKLLVRQGQKVKQGDLVILAGATGRVTGPHLHFEVRDGGAFGKPLNPRQFITFN